MKRKQHIITTIILGMLTIAMPSFCFAKGQLDSLVMRRVWDFRRNYTQAVNGVEQNVYLRYTYGSERRNPTLFLVPSMYSIARGDRQYLGESYCKLTFKDVGDYDLKRQVVSTTIPRNRRVMTSILEYTTPNLYDVSLYPGKLLSPFHRYNRHFYHYQIRQSDDKTAVITFKPKLSNTQLVTGRAIVEVNTGRLTFVSFSGEYDMVTFNVTATMSDDIQSLLPERCNTDATFRFLGNKISANFTAIYDCPTTLPDSVKNLDSREVMTQLRPVPLRKNEEAIYQQYDQRLATADSIAAAAEAADSLATDSTGKSKRRRLDDTAWDFISDNLLSRFSAHSGGISIHISPLFNPQYLSYSHSKGLSYRINIGARYAWNTHRYLTLAPTLGYNFKQRQIYYRAPLRMTYNPKRNGYAEITFANGNHISSGLLADDIRKKTGDSISVPDFKDAYIRVVNNVVAYDWLEITSGIVYHRRQSIDKPLMRALNSPEEYRSFAPMLTVRLTPWAKGPTLTANYEKSFKNVLKSNLEYERWELDAAYKETLRSMRQINMRVGTGFYTQRNSAYFVDYTNFRDENLPTGWDDEWAGQFQLLNSRWYNASRYYVRGHVSFDSPLLFLTWLPWVGRFIEMERIYVSALSIQHTRLYSEIGYGFTNRFFSTGIFASFSGTHFQDFGCKFTLELFRKW